MGRYLDLLSDMPAAENARPEPATKATEATKPPLRSLLSLLSHPKPDDSGPEFCGDPYDERAVIRQHDDGHTRDEAEPLFNPASVGNEECGTALKTASQLIAPAPWFAPYASRRQEEPPYDQPCPDRRGRNEREGVAHLHFCVICGAWGAFGYGVFADRPGRWYCFAHRPSE